MTDVVEKTESTDQEVFNRIMDRYKSPDAPRDLPEKPPAVEPKAYPAKVARMQFADEDGKPVAMERAEPIAAPEALATPEPIEKSEPTQVATPDRKRSEDYLRLTTKARESTLSGMADAEVAEWAADVRRREAGIDRTFQERAQYAKELEELRGAKATETEEQQPTPGPDLDALQSKLADELSLTDEGREALNAYMEAQVAPLRAELETARQTQARDRQGNTEAIVERARGGLGERFPQLADAETYQKVWATMARLEPDDAFGGSGRRFEDFAPELMIAAARVNGLSEANPEVAAAAEAEARSERELRAAETPTLDDSTFTPPSSLTPEQEKLKDDWSVFRDIARGKRGRQRRG